MRKLLYLLVLSFCSYTMMWAQTPSIILTTTTAVGSDISFRIACSVPSTVQIDYGDGVLVPKSVNDFTTWVSGPVQASGVVKVYGNNVTDIYCYGCNLTALDVSQCTLLKSLTCSSNKITLLDVRSNAGLTELYFTNNKLTAIDLTQNRELERLSCSSNLLTSLDVSANVKLKACDCIWVSGITQLDFSNNPLLTSLDCRLCAVSSLNVTKCPLLKTLYCFNNKLVSLDVSNNPELTTLNCTDNLLESLDVSKNLKLDILNIQRNKIPSIDISQNTSLTQFFCQANLLTSVDVSHNPLLIYFFCSINKITNLDITNNPLLIEFEGGNNLIASIDFTKNIALKSINVNSNNLSSIDVSANTELLSLDISRNKIKSVSTATNTKLTKLYVSDNLLTAINISKNPSIYTFQCYGNFFKFSTLPLPSATLTSYYYAPQKRIPVMQAIYVGEEFDYVTDEYRIKDTITSFIWKTKSGKVLTEGVDYSITNGLTVFLKPQTDSVYCEMNNSLFPNFPTYNFLRTTNLAVQIDPTIVYTQNIDLLEGWNLISINVRPNDSTIATLFKNLNVSEIKDMSSFWRNNQTDAFNVLKSISAAKGYLVKMNAAGRLSVSGIAVQTRVIALPQISSWQLIGCSSQQSTAISTIYNSSNSSVIKDFAGFWKPNNSLSSITTFEPGKAYFIKK